LLAPKVHSLRISRTVGAPPKAKKRREEKRREEKRREEKRSEEEFPANSLVLLRLAISPLRTVIKG